MKFNKLFEMAMARTSDIEKMYYHGTSNLDNAKNIFKNGFKAREITSRKLCAPIKGKIYITPSLRTGIIYAMGGIMMGHNEYRKLIGADRYGVVFEIPGNKLGDIQPDEDSVGDILYIVIEYIEKKKFHSMDYDITEDQIKKLDWLYNLANYYLSPVQFRKVQRHDASAHIWDAGKKLVKHLTDGQKLQLIDLGAHIANEGQTIIPEVGWLIDRTETEKYKDDASNFFEVAKRITETTIEEIHV